MSDLISVGPNMTDLEHLYTEAENDMSNLRWKEAQTKLRTCKDIAVKCQVAYDTLDSDLMKVAYEVEKQAVNKVLEDTSRKLEKLLKKTKHGAIKKDVETLLIDLRYRLSY